LEAQAMGLPVIATNWSGQTEFMTELNSLLLPVAHLAPAYQREPQVGFVTVADCFAQCNKAPD
jgi:glycosyltransferase involved in cell wall biosynthesis